MLLMRIDASSGTPWTPYAIPTIPPIPNDANLVAVLYATVLALVLALILALILAAVLNYAVVAVTAIRLITGHKTSTDGRATKIETKEKT